MNLEFDPLTQYDKFCNCNNLSNCRCGENNVHEWCWDKEHCTQTIVLLERNLEVKFHNGYSFGTAVVRGDSPLEKGRLHYWEVKMLTPIYGTDIMVGVGTNKIDLNSARYGFCSFLGFDKQSFGFSYQGHVQHGGEKRRYGACFGQGSLVGVYLNTWKGTLEFFLNRKSLGVAFTGLRDITLYPMVSSTAAGSKMRLTCSCSVQVSLQIESLLALKSSQRAYLAAKVPGLPSLTQSTFVDIVKPPSNDDDDDEEDSRDEFDFLTDYMIFDDFDFALIGIGRKKKRRKGACNDYLL